MASLKYKTQNGYEPIPAQVVTKTNAQQGNGIGTCSTSSGTALAVTLANYELVLNGFIAVTFDHDVPASATLNVNGKGAKPIIYKGNAIEDNVIKEDDTVTFCYDGTNYVVTSLGAGGGTIVWPEFVTISLTQSGGSDSELIGATVVVTDDDTSETILSTTWQGSGIAIQLENSANYTVTVGGINNYLIVNNSQSFTANSGMLRIITFDYVKEYVDLGLPSGRLWCTHNIGATTPYELGKYFGWGQTTGYYAGEGHNFGGESIGPNTNIPLAQDAAYNNSNHISRLPTKTECEELVNRTNKTLEIVNGIICIKFKSKTNGNYIIMPGGGWYYFGNYSGVTYNTEGYGVIGYWTSTYQRYTIRSSSQGSNIVVDNNWNENNGILVRGVKI